MQTKAAFSATGSKRHTLHRAPLEQEEGAVQLGVERGQLVEQRAAPLQPRHEEGRQRRVQQDALRGARSGNKGDHTQCMDAV